MRQRGFAQIIFLIVLILLGGFVFWFFKLNYSKPAVQSNPFDQTSPTLSPSIPINTISNEDFFTEIYQEFQKTKTNYDSEIRADGSSSVWWVSDDNLNIISHNSPGIILDTFNCRSDSSRTNFVKMAEELGSAVNDVMAQNGFKTNLVNSSNSINDERYYDYIQAYEKGAIKAVFTANPDCWTDKVDGTMHYTFSFEYTSDFNNYYKEQAQFLRDLNIKDAIINVRNRSGDFIYLNVNYRRTGYYTIAKSVNSKWIELYSGQDWPGCEIVEKYEIPQDIISSSECY